MAAPPAPTQGRPAPPDSRRPDGRTRVAGPADLGDRRRGRPAPPRRPARARGGPAAAAGPGEAEGALTISCGSSRRAPGRPRAAAGPRTGCTGARRRRRSISRAPAEPAGDRPEHHPAQLARRPVRSCGRRARGRSARAVGLAGGGLDPGPRRQLESRHRIPVHRPEEAPLLAERVFQKQGLAIEQALDFARSWRAAAG